MSPTAQLLDALRTAPTPFLPEFYSRTLVRPGERHLRDHRNCQDHALTGSCDEGTVLVVSDGVSCYHDEFGHRVPSCNEAGAILVAELALKAALEGLRSHLPPDAIRDLIAVEIHSGLRPLWNLLGASGERLLAATLLVGMITNDYTRIYVAGDGCWGIFLPLGTPTDTLGTGLVVSERAHHLAVRGSKTTIGMLPETASTAARLGSQDIVRALPLVLSHDGPAFGAWVASDGLADETKLMDLVTRAPCTSYRALESTLTRPKGCDDVAVAWASDRFPPEGATTGEGFDV